MPKYDYMTVLVDNDKFKNVVRIANMKMSAKSPGAIIMIRNIIAHITNGAHAAFVGYVKMGCMEFAPIELIFNKHGGPDNYINVGNIASFDDDKELFHMTFAPLVNLHFDQMVSFGQGAITIKLINCSNWKSLIFTVSSLLICRSHIYQLNKLRKSLPQPLISILVHLQLRKHLVLYDDNRNIFENQVSIQLTNLFGISTD